MFVSILWGPSTSGAPTRPQQVRSWQETRLAIRAASRAVWLTPRLAPRLESAHSARNESARWLDCAQESCKKFLCFSFPLVASTPTSGLESSIKRTSRTSRTRRRLESRWAARWNGASRSAGCRRSCEVSTWRLHPFIASQSSDSTGMSASIDGYIQTSDSVARREGKSQRSDQLA